MYIFKFFLFLFILLGTIQVSASTNTDIPTVVPLHWLKNHYEDSHLVLIDVRDRADFKAGHLKNAVNIPAFEKLFVGKNMLMPGLKDLQEIFSKAGIDNESLVVVYGNNQLIWAARFYWISKVLGHENIGLLEVGYNNWKRDDLPTTTLVYKPKRSNFIPQVDNSKIKTQLSTLMAIGKEVIVDGRPSEFYEGKKSHAKRFGHIPTALNYPGSLIYTKTKDGSKMKSFSELKKLYKNLPKDKEIILYCEDGADAALIFLVLKKLKYNASVYEGSWMEWANNPNLPVENPSKRE